MTEVPPAPPPAPPLDALLRRAGHALPAETVAELAPGHALLEAMLALLPAQPPAAEPAVVFRPVAAPTPGDAP
jgi:hypothetical protein